MASAATAESRQPSRLERPVDRRGLQELDAIEAMSPGEIQGRLRRESAAREGIMVEANPLLSSPWASGIHLDGPTGSAPASLPTLRADLRRRPVFYLVESSCQLRCLL